MAVPKPRVELGSSAVHGALLLIVLGCGRSPVYGSATQTQDDHPTSSEDVPDWPRHICPRSSACGDVPCADTTRAAAAIDALLEAAEARGFADVVEPLDGEQVGETDNVVLTYALRHPVFDAIETFVATGPTFTNIEDHVDEWSITWLDPEVTVADRAWIQEQIDGCADARAHLCGPTASVEYDPCVHNQVDFGILVGLEPDDVEFVGELDPVAILGLYCAYSQGC